MKNGKPNVLLLVTDDQRYGTIHALGNEQIYTPNMDALVKRGTSFVSAHIPGGTTGAVCMPSRAMLHSGRTLFRLQGCGEEIPPEHITLGEAMRKTGYHCMGIGKWHNGTQSYTRSFCDGDNIFFGGMWDHWNVPVNHYSADGNYDNMIPFTPNFTANHKPVFVRAQQICAGIHSTDLFSDSAVHFINEYDGEAPFFMSLSYLAPHDPRTMPEKFRTMYDPSKIDLPPNFSEMPTVNAGWSRGRDETIEAYPRTENAVRQHIADYYGMISHIDSRVGDIMSALEARGILDDTIVVLCGDNGLAIGQHGLMGKQNIYEHSTRVPLIFAGPGIPQDRCCNQLVYLLDIYPTLCEMCGIEIPKSVDGRSFAKLFQDDSAVTRSTLYLAFQGRIRGAMDERYKLIEYRTEDIKLSQLFDLKLDPWEKYNLFDTEGYEDITARLRTEMLRLRDEWQDAESETGRVFWAAYDAYENAAVINPHKPTGRNLAAQMALSK